MTNLAHRLADRRVRRAIQGTAIVVLVIGALAYLWADPTVATSVALLAVAVLALGGMKLSLIALVASVYEGNRQASDFGSAASALGVSGARPDPKGHPMPANRRIAPSDTEGREQRTKGEPPSYKERASRMRWFHALDLGEFQTSGRFRPDLPPNYTLFPAIDLVNDLNVKGSECLDIGTAHGLMAFGLEGMGGMVTATDARESPSHQFQLAHEALESSVSYEHDVSLRDSVDRFGMNSFDVVVCAGVMYHLLDPVDAVRVPRQLLRRNGYLVLETAFDSSAQSASITLNATATPLVKEPHTYWLPSESAILSLLQLFGFDIVGVRRIQQADRIAVLARSVSASEIHDKVPEQVRRVWEVGFRDPLAAGGAWNPEPAGTAGVRGPTRLDPFRDTIDMQNYRPVFPPHPVAMTNVVGRTR